MATAVALRDENTFEQPTPSPGRTEVLARYRHLRKIGKRHHSEVMKFLSKDAILHHGRRLGLFDGKTFLLDSEDELTLAFDLAIYTAPEGRGRDEDCSSPPAQIPACAANAPGSSLGSNVGSTRLKTACAPARSRQSDRRGNSAQCPNHGRLSAVPLG